MDKCCKGSEVVKDECFDRMHNDPKKGPTMENPWGTKPAAPQSNVKGAKGTNTGKSERMN